jgi:hypothetical protein
MKFSLVSTIALLAASVVANPFPTEDKHDDKHCNPRVVTEWKVKTVVDKVFVTKYIPGPKVFVTKTEYIKKPYPVTTTEKKFIVKTEYIKKPYPVTTTVYVKKPYPVTTTEKKIIVKTEYIKKPYPVTTTEKKFIVKTEYIKKPYPVTTTEKKIIVKTEYIKKPYPVTTTVYNCKDKDNHGKDGKDDHYGGKKHW